MDEKQRILGYLGDTPITIQGYSWLPFTQLATYLGLFWYRSRRSPDHHFLEHVQTAGVSTIAILGSEWLHNLAHVAASNLIHKPMDEVQIIAGMPRCIYYTLNDLSVTPAEHIQRAAAGPLFNASLLPLLLTLRKLSPSGSVARELWDAAVGMNIFLVTVSLLPIPGIDGGPILKWRLVSQGYSPSKADQTVRRVNGPLAIVLALASALAYLRQRRGFALLLALLSGTALGAYMGWLQEDKLLQSTRLERNS